MFRRDDGVQSDSSLERRRRHSGAAEAECETLQRRRASHTVVARVAEDRPGSMEVTGAALEKVRERRAKREKLRQKEHDHVVDERLKKELKFIARILWVCILGWVLGHCDLTPSHRNKLAWTFSTATAIYLLCVYLGFDWVWETILECYDEWVTKPYKYLWLKEPNPYAEWGH
eukprot:gnl/TRDRNA2_/TRDRNA2_31065_c0_seq1.p1 gnl/TRDRNA2_/TRDRNA2_31065_c0~~gnl/TRDRNA2_/TRDRNA2_31065_c0_seq1.p1  ORF type:complete len:181 (+),score=23.09 gnl/TRDRNA2_/TRDRNA2_31065_c0_seq1:27-545(+)